MLYDASGKIMQQQLLNCAKEVLTPKNPDISKPADGVYQVKILMPDENVLTRKFNKQ